MTNRPLPCTRCGSQAGVAEDYEGHADWGLAVIDDDGVVRPASQQVEIFNGEPVRVRAVCSNDECGHQWTLRRRFEPTAL
jgi:hypothetical protein